MKTRIAAAIGLAITFNVAFSTPTLAALIIEYQFEGNLLDTAPSGATADNLSARNNVNTIITPPAGDYQTGVPGLPGQTALRLGQNTSTNTQWVGAPDSIDADVASTAPVGAFTVEAFIKADVINLAGFNRVLLHWGAGDQYHLALHNGKASIFIGDAPSVELTGGSVLSTGQWYHLAATGNGSTLTLYLDGVSLGTLGYTGPLNNDNNLIFLGSTPGASNHHFVGLVDEVRVWNEAKDHAYMTSRAALLVPIPAPAAMPMGLAMLSLIAARRRRAA